MKLQKNRYRFIKRFYSQREILLNTDLALFTNFYFEKRWSLIRDRFLLKVIIEKYPKIANRPSKKVSSFPSLLFPYPLSLALFQNKKQVYLLDLLKLKKTFTDL